MNKFNASKAYKKSIKSLTIAIIAVALIGTAAASQSVYLESRTIAPGDTKAPVQDFSGSDKEKHVIVQLEESVTLEQRSKLESDRVRLQGYIPENAWYATVDNSVRNLQNKDAVAKVIPIKKSDKISEDIADNLDKEKSSNGKLVLDIEFFEDISDKEKAEILKKYGKPSSNHEDSVAIELIDAQEALSNLASEDAVKFISQNPGKPEKTLEDSRSLINADTVQKDYGFAGSGLTAAVWDSGLAGDHRDLTYSDKRIEGDSAGISDHATKAAGVLLGGGKIDNNNRGIAPDARLATYKWPTSSTNVVFNELADASNNKDAVVSHNSWGWSIDSYSDMGEYGRFSKAYDAVIHGESSAKPLSVVFSAGNEGNDGWQSRYDTITSAGATSKNTITVGSVNDRGDVSGFSSWGPTDDGRLKPDLMANGNYVETTTLGDNYAGTSGTSISAPAASGAIVLVNDAFQDKTGNLPSPATAKAILIDTTNDIKTEGPDYKSGYGIIDVEKAVDRVQNGEIISSELSSSSDKNTYTFDAEKGERFTLAWSDHPAETSASRTLVNDLDLVVKDSNGQRIYPYTLDSESPSEAADTDSEDERNPVEQVKVPDSGTYNVTVDAENMPEPSQKYSLVTSAEKTGSSPPPSDDPSDTNPPEINLEGPNSVTYSTRGVYFGFSTQEELSSATYTVNDQTKDLENSDGSWKKIDYLPTGKHTVKFKATDTAGNTNTKKVDFGVDTQAPVFTHMTPADGEQVSGTIDLKARFDEDVENVAYTVDGGQNQIMQQSSGTYKDQVSLSDGDHEIVFKAQDAAGNIREEEATVHVGESSGPKTEFKIESPTETTYLTSGIQIKVNPGESLKTVEYSLTGQSGELEKADGLYEEMITVTDGSHQLEITGTDMDGNTRTKTVNFEAALTAPSIEIVSPEETVSSNDVDFKIRSDAEVARVTVAGNDHIMEEASSGVHEETLTLESGTYDGVYAVKGENGNVRKQEFSFQVG